jgi:sec-independent protein translocase protein TatC
VRTLRLPRARRRIDAADMTFFDHLAELRNRLIISIVAVVIGAAVGWTLWNWVLDVATQPYCDAQRARDAVNASGEAACELYITNPMELLTTRLSVAGYLGIFFASPIILWQVWRFVTPGLHRNEKKYAIPFVVSSVVLFVLGAFVAWLVFPKALSFFLNSGGDVETLFNPTPYLKMILLMMLVSGFVFEMPLFLVFLQLAGVLKSRQLRSWRRYAVCLNFVVAAIATPSQDPYSLFAMALPMCIFYEVAILIGRVLKK